MKMLVFSAAALCAVAAAAPVLAASAPAPQPAQRAIEALTRAEAVQKAQARFATLDTDRDGFITKAEMASAQTATHQRMQEHRTERASLMFERMDSNRDGAISRAEFDSAHQAMAGHMRGKRMGMRGMHGGMGHRMFATADADKDGRVSLQEATNAVAAHFDRVDADHDGTVTPDERRAAHQAMRGRSGRR